MENPLWMEILFGKSLINSPFWIAMFTRGYDIYIYNYTYNCIHLQYIYIYITRTVEVVSLRIEEPYDSTDGDGRYATLHRKPRFFLKRGCHVGKIGAYPPMVNQWYEEMNYLWWFGCPWLVVSTIFLIYMFKHVSTREMGWFSQWLVGSKRFLWVSS